MQIILTMEPPKTTAQQKGYNTKTNKFYTKEKVKAVEEEYLLRLKPFQPKEPCTSAVMCSIMFIYEKAEGGWKTTKPDVDNMAKLLLDCLTKLHFWKDDSQIVNLNLSKIYGAEPQIKISINEVK